MKQWIIAIGLCLVAFGVGYTMGHQIDKVVDQWSSPSPQ